MRYISVIVPVYHGEQYIASIIQQVEACQIYLNVQDYVELLFINDAPDAPLIQKWESDRVHITVVNTDENVGIHGARLKGLKRCQGDYVLFLDQDDRIRPEYFKSQLHAIGENDAVVCQAIHGERLLYSYHPVFENILSKESALLGWNPIISPGQVLLKRRSIPEIWIENVLKYNGADDWFLWLCMISKECSFALNQEVLYEHVLSGENTSENIVEMLQSEQEVMGILFEKKLFSNNDYGLLMEGFFKRNLERTESLSFFKEKAMLLDKWIKLNGHNIKYAEYLVRSGLRTVAIYGCGTLGEYLYGEIKDEIKVKYFIDKNADKIHREIPVYPLHDKLPEVDGVIVTLVKEPEKIGKRIQEMHKANVLILKEWLR